MADCGQSDKSSSELSDCDEEKGKHRDDSKSPLRRRHKKSKHSKKKSKKKSSKRKRHRKRSRSRSKERHSGKVKKQRDGSPSEKDQVDVKTDCEQQIDELTNKKISIDASANKEVSCVAPTNQNGVEPGKVTNQKVAICVPVNQNEFPGTLVIKNEPKSPNAEKQLETSINQNGLNMAESSTTSKAKTVEHKLSPNTNLEEIYDPGLYIASVKEEHDSEQITIKESHSVKDEQSKLASKRKRSSSIERRSKSKESQSKERQSRLIKSRSKERSKSNKKSRSRSKDRSIEKSRQRSKDRSILKSADHSHSKQKSRSKSRDRKRSESRDRERSKSREHKKTESRDRKRSKSRDRERSKSKEHKKTESRDRKRSKSRSHERSKSREHQRSRERQRSKSLEKHRIAANQSRSKLRRPRSVGRGRRSRSRSAGRRRRSRSAGRRRSLRSRSFGRPRNSRSRSTGRRRRSRSAGRRRRSRSTGRGRRSRSRSAGRRRSHRSRSRSPRKIDRSNDAAAASVPVNLTIALGLPTTSVTTTTASEKPTKSIADFTALCKKLTEDKEEEKNEIKIENENVSQVYHPFSVKPAKEIVIPPVILPVSKPTEPPRPIEQAFPVSRGNQHKTKEDTNESVVEGVDGSVAAAENVFHTAAQKEKLDVSGLVAKRMEAQNRLQSNPHDYEARLVLEEVQMKIQNWASVNLKPGQYTGESLVSSFTPKENINSGYQAWARKDMFHNLTPIRGGVGMKLLQKMGWRPGQVLGKRGEGSYEPIALNVKTDRRGLVSVAEAGAKGKGGGKGGGKNIMAAQAVQGKHPVSALAELCTKRKWQSPAYNIAHESGPAHKKDFLYQVIVNGNSYQHNIASNNKKLAKAEAAFAALKALGIVPADAAMSL